MATMIDDGDWTNPFRDKVINHGISGGKLTKKQIEQLKAGVKAGNRGADSQKALDNADPSSF